MSRVTRRMVSWVLRRSARSGAVSVGDGDRRGRRPPPARHCWATRQTPGQPAVAAVEAGVAPLDFLLGRGDEHHVEPQRVGADLLQHRVGIDDVALRLRHHVAVLQHHPLGEQVRERLAVVDHPEVAEHPGEEARVDQVQDGVLDAAASRSRPGTSTSTLAGSNGSAVVVGVGEAVEVPRRVDERVHRVGLAPRRPAAGRAGDVDELRHVGQRRIAAAGELGHLGQLHRQLLVGHRRRRRPPGSGSSGSACPSSAGARCPSPSAGTAPCPRRCRAPWRRRSSPSAPPPTSAR